MSSLFCLCFHVSIVSFLSLKTNQNKKQTQKHRRQSTPSGVNTRLFRSSWYGSASTLNVCSISVVHSPASIWPPLPPPYPTPLVQMSVGTQQCMRTVSVHTKRWISQIHCLSSCVSSVSTPHHNTLLMPTPRLAMLLSTPHLHPHPTPRGCSVPTSRPIGLVGDLRTLSQPKRSFFFVLLWMPGTEGGRGGGYFTKLVSIQIANFHMVLADQKKCVCGHWVSADNLSAWLMSKWFSLPLFLFRKEQIDEWQASTGQVLACMWKLFGFLQLMEMSKRFHYCLTF